MCKWFIILFAAGIFTALLSCRQKDGPPMPLFNILLIDSTTMLSSEQIPKGRPVVLLYFSPDCEHCQDETADILAKIDSLKNIRFYFITIDPFERLRLFRDYYRLSRYPNIILGRDYSFEFLNKIKPSGTPYLLVYDTQKRLTAVCNGFAAATTIISLTKKQLK